LKKTPVWFYVSVLVTIILSSISVAMRHRAEMLNRAVTIAVEIDTVQSLASAQGLTLSQALENLKGKGLGAVVLSEETIAQLISEGKAELVKGELRALDPQTQARIDRGLANRFEKQTQLDGATLPAWLQRSTAVGLNPREAERANGAGLMIIARHSNVAGASEEYIRTTLAWSKENGAKIFLPQGEQVLGRRDALKTTVDTLKELGIYYATPEFARIGGDANVVAMAPDNVVRLHSAQTAELDKLSMSDAVERYSKAARERNMRVLLVRPASLASAEPIGALGEFIEKIKEDVEGQGGPMGLQIGSAHPLSDSNVPKLLIFLIALSVVPVAYFIGISFTSNSTLRLLGLALFLALAASSYVSVKGTQLTAFLAAVVFPTAAMLTLDGRKLRHPALEFLIISLISLAGGLAVAGMLNGLPYFVKAQVFPGVKVSVFLPIALVGGYYFVRLARAKEAMQSPITWGASLFGIVLVAALGYLMARTGNESPAGVSSLELQFRNLLDTLLIVRPRTKEFLIGHPALIVAIGMLVYTLAHEKFRSRFGGWTALLLAGGAVGQTSIVNTMCHLHTPVALSLWRIANGLLLGLILGVVLWLLIKTRLPREQPS
jgi:hypothetical protein